LADIFREGMEARVKALQALEQRDFYFACFFKTCPEGSAGEQQ
jgi:hypothetical protein